MFYRVNPAKGNHIGIPRYLVRDEIDGVAYPYKGIEEVLSGKIDPEGIMGNGSLQSFILSDIFTFLLKNLDRNEYTLLPNIWHQISEETNLTYALGVWRKSMLPPDSISNGPATTAPSIAIEVDERVDCKSSSFEAYRQKKVESFFQSGGERLVWVNLDPKLVYVFRQAKALEEFKWAEHFEITSGLSFCIEKELNRQGITFE
ncbi:MAG: hypothetical protein AAF741_12105 [Bacteroidota bacterium]